jgi:GNAT superfamily N-acetyltransferase
MPVEPEPWTGLVVRPAGPPDETRLTAWNLALALESEGLELDAERLGRGVRAALAAAECGSYRIAELDGRPVGGLFVTREWSDWRCGWWWWIQSVFVEPEARGRGVYEALHGSVLRDAAEAGDVVGVRLYVEHENRRAMRVYERVGMGRSGYVIYEQPLEP